MADDIQVVSPTPPAFTPAPEDFMQQGARMRPKYVERNPSMWAVGETDLEALSLASNISTAAFAIGSFCLGVAVNIIVSYGGADKLTDVGKFMLYKCTWMIGVAALIFFGVGLWLQIRKGSLWDKIKSESRQVTPPH